eukprot:3190329-Rhodomonas_salina.2
MAQFPEKLPPGVEKLPGEEFIKFGSDEASAVKGCKMAEHIVSTETRQCHHPYADIIEFGATVARRGLTKWGG